MIFGLLTIFFVLLINISLIFLLKIGRAKFPKVFQRVWVVVIVVAVRLVVFFLGAHLVLITQKNPLILVLYIFGAAVSQMSIQIYLLNKRLI